MPNLVLVGFMGTGKTTVGRRLAARLGMRFVDTDQEVERVTGMTVDDVFKKLGPVRFRSEEKAAIRRVTREDNQVIATGGGAVLDAENMTMLNNGGVVVCLMADHEVIFDRVSKKKTRPLLQTDNPRETIISLLAERMPYYKAAGIPIDTSRMELDEVVTVVARVYKTAVASGQRPAASDTQFSAADFGSKGD